MSITLQKNGAFPTQVWIENTPQYDGAFILGQKIEPPKVTGAIAGAYNKVRVSFDQQMLQENPGDPKDVLNPDNYTFSVIGGVDIVSSRVLLYQISPTIVTVVLTSGMTNGAAYTVEVNNTVESEAGTALDPAYDNASFTGLGMRPQVTKAEAPDTNTIDVFFNESMENNAALTEISNYLITGPTSLVVSEIIYAGPTRVTLTVDDMHEGGHYRITVNGIQDIAGNPIDNYPHNSATFIGIGPDLNALLTQYAEHGTRPRTYVFRNSDEDG